VSLIYMVIQSILLLNSKLNKKNRCEAGGFTAKHPLEGYKGIHLIADTTWAFQSSASPLLTDPPADSR